MEPENVPPIAGSKWNWPRFLRTTFLIVRSVWLALCLFTVGFSVYYKAVGEDTEVFCVLTMEMLTYPVGGTCIRIVGKAAYAWIPGTGTFMTSGGLGPIVAIWSLYFVFGMLQWFWVMPRLAGWMKRYFASVPVPPGPASN